jgi:hypothetical protein
MTRHRAINPEEGNLRLAADAGREQVVGADIDLAGGDAKMGVPAKARDIADAEIDACLETIEGGADF